MFSISLAQSILVAEWLIRLEFIQIVTRLLFSRLNNLANSISFINNALELYKFNYKELLFGEWWAGAYTYANLSNCFLKAWRECVTRVE